MFVKMLFHVPFNSYARKGPELLLKLVVDNSYHPKGFISRINDYFS